MSAHIVGPAHLCSSVEALWERGLPPGDRTGWPSVDRHYTVAPGQMTVLTGWPGSGKSEWLDALLVNLWHQGWRFAVFSPENQPIELHASKLLEKVSGKPFGRGPTDRLTREEVRTLMVDELAGHFAFVRAEEDGALRAQAVLEAAEPWLANFKDAKRGLVIDPWNELEHWRPPNLSETEYISQQLSLLRNWARANHVHVWIVAHPQKMRREEGKLPIPRPDMIAGSQHWWNKADAAITVYRDLADHDSPEVQIHVMKVRFKHIGRPGLAVLHYDRVTGRYHEPPSAKPAAVPSRWDLREGEA
jgi:twinkle protein